MQDIEKTCERLIIIDGGQKLYDGSLDNIKSNYVSSRIIEAEFEELPAKINIPDVTVTAVDNTKMKKQTNNSNNSTYHKRHPTKCSAFLSRYFTAFCLCFCHFIQLS